MVLVLGPSVVLLTARSATAADFTWSGGAPIGEPNWSNGTNWSGTAPSGAVGKLEFPTLTSAACMTFVPEATCYVSSNNIAGLVANSLTIGDTYYNLYDFRGDALSV